MGIGTWAIAGAGAFALSRLVRAGRPAGWRLEGAVALAAALAAGLAATALDFGGWREPDWRAVLFAVAVAFGALGIERLVRLARR